MTVKVIFFICAQVLLIQYIDAQCIGAYNSVPASLISAAPCAAGLYAGPAIASPASCGAGLASQSGWDGLGASNAAALAASNGGGLLTSSSSLLAPNGLSLISENAIEGPLAVSGALPFLGTVALEGILPTAGAGGVAYGCGNGEVGILSEDISAAGLNGIKEGALGLGAGSLGYGAGALAYGAGTLGYGASALGCGANLARPAYNSYGGASFRGIGACVCGTLAY